MKNLMITLVLGLSLALMTAAPAFAAPAGEPTDLVAMQEAGLSPESIGRFLSQNLSQRAAPQMEGRLMIKLAQYGGDPLAAAYLDLDKASAQQQSRDFSPQVVEQLMAGGTSPAELNLILAEEAARAAQKDQPKTALMPPALPPQVVQAPPAAPAPPQMAAMAPPTVSYPDSPRLVEPTRPRGFQDLRPGQAADPASRLPLPYSTYDIRQNRQDGDIRRINQPAGSSGGWMGVAERELPDGHLVETNSLGQIQGVGQEVYARPSGHQVYRYWTGNPDNLYSGAVPRQEQKNREDLHIIFSRGDR